MEIKNKGLQPGELELINRYTRRELKEDEVYVFSLVLCDNDLDRDNERFSVHSLKKLEKLFVGVTGVMDHDARSGNQTARIFSCRTETVNDRKAFDGEPYVRLTARAYMPVTEANREFIEQLESGIRKEISVSCSISRRICSVCGNENGGCSHIRGISYEGSRCFVTLEDPTDAYEWSFVAVPAQRRAGVIKAYRKDREIKSMDIEKRLYSGEAQSFSADEINVIAEKLRTLHQKASDGEVYRKKLESDIVRMAAVVMPELRRETLDYIIGHMNAQQLEELCNAFTKKAQSTIPLKVQLAPGADNDNNAYRNI